MNVWRASLGGFTLLELLLVVALIALASAGASLALRDSEVDALERDAQRLIAHLERARAWSRATDVPVVWQPTEGGFRLQGMRTGDTQEAQEAIAWLSPNTRVDAQTRLLLGPEPVLAPQQLRLFSHTAPAQTLWIGSDGVRPFSLRTGAP